MKKLFALLFSLALPLNSLSKAIASDSITVVIPEHYDVVTVTPPEQKVVELHITKIVPDETSATDKKHKKKKKKLEEQHYLCSGAFVDDHGDIITAKHCTDGASDILVVTSDYQEYESTTIVQNDKQDLALVHIDKSNTPYFSLAKQVTRGEKIFILGSPLAITNTLSQGIIAKLDGDLTLVDCSALPGNSGGPVFDENGDLVGILVAGFVVGFGVCNLNVAQGTDSVRFFLDKNLKK
jgi:S1-C subfamily serine protease